MQSTPLYCNPADLKGTYNAKFTFMRCLTTDVYPQCVNNQLLMVKIHPLIFYNPHKQALAYLPYY